MTIPSSAVYDERYRGDYRQQLAGFEIARYNALRHFVRRVLRLGPAGRVLDYGAGSGLHVDLWEELFPDGARYPRHAGRYWLLDAGGTSRHAGTFDVVVSVEVMEHVDDLRGYVRDIHGLLRPGGRFVWTTPCANPGSIEHIYSAITGGITPTGEGYRRWTWEDPTHVRRLKTAEIAGVLAAHGFEDVRFRFRSHLWSFLCTYAPTSRLTALRIFSGLL